MKHLLPIILSILLLSACGESGRMQFEQLQQIDSIAEVNADSAVAMIKTINRDTLSSNDNKYYYDLLKIRTNDKAYIAHTSDSAILSVINYFENHDFNNLLPVAYYYGGRVYSDLGDAPQAIEYFHKAIDCPNINPITMAVAYSQMASLYSNIRVFDLAIEAYTNAMELNHQNEDSISFLYNMRSIGEIYSVQNKNDSAFIIYNKALKLAENMGLEKLSNSIKLNIGNWHINNNNYDDASTILSSIRTNLPNEDSTTIANSYAHIYYKLNIEDSTILYCNKLIKSKNLNAQLNGYNILTNLYMHNNSTEDAYNSIIMSTQLSDSIRKLNTPYEIRQLSSIYNYQIRERENNKLKQEAHEYEIKIIYLCGSIFIIVVVALITTYALRMKNKAQKEKINRILGEHYQSQNLISNAEKRISTLEDLLANETNKSQSLINELAIQKESLQLFTQQAKLREDAANAIETAEIVARFRKTLSNDSNPSDNDWEQLDKYINQQFPGFKNVLYKLAKLSEIEYQVCLLLKAKFTPTEITKLVNLSKSGLGNARKRLFVKAFKTDGTASDWDKFIISL